MSSIIAHIASGGAVYFAQKRQKPRWLLPVLILLAIVPDLDYLAFWFLHINFEPRFSHSLAFCLSISTIAWLTARRPLPFMMFALASCSHLILDFLVGVHPLPLFWPISPYEALSPIGLLPSAGQLRLGNFYLWRNLSIESGMVFPVLGLMIALAQGQPLRPKRWLCLLAIELACLVWSLSLNR